LEYFQKRLKALEERIASDGIALSDAQVAALEKKKIDDEACGEIKTIPPPRQSKLQDTFYLENIKGVGRIYQQTFVCSGSMIPDT
jgi:hypothetical protein